MCETDFVTAWNLDEAEKSKLLRKSRMPWVTMQCRYVLGTVDIGLSNIHLGRICSQRDLVPKRLHRVRIEHVVRPLRHPKVAIIDEGFTPERERQYDRTIIPLRGEGFHHDDLIWRSHIEE